MTIEMLFDKSGTAKFRKGGEKGDERRPLHKGERRPSRKNTRSHDHPVVKGKR